MLAEAHRVTAAGRRAWEDQAVAAVLAIAAFLLGTYYVRAVVAGGGRPEFYQVEFAPAVMLACGGGYVAPNSGVYPTLAAFLAQQTDTFSCRDLPPQPALNRLTGPQATWKYLIGTVGVWWRVSGVSWTKLMPLCGVLFAATIVLTYFLFRVLAGSAVAAAGAAALMLSPLQLGHLPHLRDYSKAPFMTAIFLLLALIVRAPLAPKRTLILAACYGMTLGVGIGFRNDLLITIPAFVIAVALFLPGPLLAHGAVKLGALVVALLAFLVTAAPVLGAYGEGGGAGQSHVALLGLMSPFDPALGVGDAGVYEFGYVYSDTYLGAMVSDFAGRVQGASTPIAIYDSAYDHASAALAREVIALRPADIIARAWAAVLQTIGLPATSAADVAVPQFVTGGRLLPLFQWRVRAIAWFPRMPMITVGLALLLISVADLRLALGAALMLVYFGGYPALQFQTRHLFHLTVMSIAAMVFVTQRVIAAASHPAAWTRLSWSAMRRPATRVAIVAVAMTLGTVAPVAAARAYQQRTLGAMLRASLAAAHEPLQLAEFPADGVRRSIAIVDPPARRRAIAHRGVTVSEYLRLEFDGARCDGVRAALTFHYDASTGLADFTRDLDVALDPTQGPTVALVPIYYYVAAQPADPLLAQRYGFSSLTLPAEERACLTAVERLVSTTEPAVRMTIRAWPGWERLPLYQWISRVERSSPRVAPEVYTIPPGRHVDRATMTAAIELIAPDEAVLRAAGVRSSGRGALAVDGVAASGPYDYLLRLKSQPLQAGDQFIVEGRLNAGGLSIGVLRDSQWIALVSIERPGPFLAVVEVPSSGDGSLVFANNLISGGLDNHFDIVRAGRRAVGAAR
jgi:hypothetical protein